jgi:hypothetical protein
MLCKVNDNGSATILPHPVKAQALQTSFRNKMRVTKQGLHEVDWLVDRLMG